VDRDPWPPETPRALCVVGDEDAIFVKVGAPNTGPGDARDAPEEVSWPD
jgi:hypothetical protein